MTKRASAAAPRNRSKLRRGETEPALAEYAKRDRITHARDRYDALDRLVADWHATGDPDGTV